MTAIMFKSPRSLSIRSGLTSTGLIATKGKSSKPLSSNLSLNSVNYKPMDLSKLGRLFRSNSTSILSISLSKNHYSSCSTSSNSPSLNSPIPQTLSKPLGNCKLYQGSSTNLQYYESTPKDNPKTPTYAPPILFTSFHNYTLSGNSVGTDLTTAYWSLSLDAIIPSLNSLEFQPLELKVKHALSHDLSPFKRDPKKDPDVAQWVACSRFTEDWQSSLLHGVLLFTWGSDYGKEILPAVEQQSSVIVSTAILSSLLTLRMANLKKYKALFSVHSESIQKANLNSPEARYWKKILLLRSSEGDWRPASEFNDQRKEGKGKGNEYVYYKYGMQGGKLNVIVYHSELELQVLKGLNSKSLIAF